MLPLNTHRLCAHLACPVLQPLSAHPYQAAAPWKVAAAPVTFAPVCLLAA